MSHMFVAVVFAVGFAWAASLGLGGFAKERERLAARIERLKNFVSSAEDTAELLRQQIADLDAKDAADSQE